MVPPRRLDPGFFAQMTRLTAELDRTLLLRLREPDAPDEPTPPPRPPPPHAAAAAPREDDNARLAALRRRGVAGGVIDAAQHDALLALAARETDG